MTPIPNGLSIGDYRERLSHYKDAETEKNAMISVSCHGTLIFFVPLFSSLVVMVGAHRQLGQSSDRMQTNHFGSGE